MFPVMVLLSFWYHRRHFGITGLRKEGEGVEGKQGVRLAVLGSRGSSRYFWWYRQKSREGDKPFYSTGARLPTGA